jgi:hypothetical protein
MRSQACWIFIHSFPLDFARDVNTDGIGCLGTCGHELRSSCERRWHHADMGPWPHVHPCPRHCHLYRSIDKRFEKKQGGVGGLRRGRAYWIVLRPSYEVQSLDWGPVGCKVPG